MLQLVTTATNLPEGVRSEAAIVLLQLIQHPRCSIQSAAYQAAAALAVADGPLGTTSPAVGSAFCTPELLESLAVTGLASEALRSDAAQLLNAAVSAEPGLAVHALSPWAAWVGCYEGDAAVGGIISGVLSLLGREREERSQWALLEPLIRRLFSREAGARKAAASALASAAPSATLRYPGVAEALRQKVDADPFGGLLDGGANSGITAHLTQVFR